MDDLSASDISGRLDSGPTSRLARRLVPLQTQHPERMFARFREIIGFARTGGAGLKLPCRGGIAYNQRIVAISSEGSQTMGMLDEGPDVNTVKEAAMQGHAHASSPRRVPCNDATGRVLPITPEEQAQDAKAIAAFVELMLRMPDEDPPGAWEEAMRDLDAQRPHGSFSRVSIRSWRG